MGKGARCPRRINAVLYYLLLIPIRMYASPALDVDAAAYPVFPHKRKDGFDAFFDGKLHRFVPEDMNTGV